MSKEEMKAREQEVKEAIMKGKPSGAYIELHEGEKMYKIAILVSKKSEKRVCRTASGDREMDVRWGVKFLSKEYPNGKIFIAFYFGYVDNNNDWYNKHGGGQTPESGVEKGEFEKTLAVMELAQKATGMELDVQIQDYSIFSNAINQTKFGQKQGTMEVGRIKLSKTEKKKVEDYFGKPKSG